MARCIVVLVVSPIYELICFLANYRQVYNDYNNIFTKLFTIFIQARHLECQRYTGDTTETRMQRTTNY